jgi:hypothetical protein
MKLNQLTESIYYIKPEDITHLETDKAITIETEKGAIWIPKTVIHQLQYKLININTGELLDDILIISQFFVEKETHPIDIPTKTTPKYKYKKSYLRKIPDLNYNKTGNNPQPNNTWRLYISENKCKDNLC